MPGAPRGRYPLANAAISRPWFLTPAGLVQRRASIAAERWVGYRSSGFGSRRDGARCGGGRRDRWRASTVALVTPVAGRASPRGATPCFCLVETVAAGSASRSGCSSLSKCTVQLEGQLEARARFRPTPSIIVSRSARRRRPRGDSCRRCARRSLQIRPALAGDTPSSLFGDSSARRNSVRNMGTPAGIARALAARLRASWERREVATDGHVVASGGLVVGTFGAAGHGVGAGCP